MPDLFSVNRATAAIASTATTVDSWFFLYGVSDSDASSLLGAEASQTGETSSLVTVATSPAALPVKSPDGTKLAVVQLSDKGGPAVALTVVDTATGAVASQTTLTASDDSNAMVLINPVFTADSATVVLVLSITVPTDQKTISKFNPLTGDYRTIDTATWVSHHAVGYFDLESQSLAGPFHLTDSPSLANVNVAANDKDLFLWTILELAALGGTKENPGVMPETQLSIFPIGSGTARTSTPAPGAWPTNGEPTIGFANGEVARLVYSNQLEIYSADGERQVITIEALDQPPVKGATTTMTLQPNGWIFLANGGFGTGVIVDPAKSYEIRSVVQFSPSDADGRVPPSNAVLSADGTTIYAIGSPKGDGISAYDAGSGALAASYASGQTYYKVHLLNSGSVLALSIDSPRLSFFDPSLALVDTADTTLRASEVY